MNQHTASTAGWSRRCSPLNKLGSAVQHQCQVQWGLGTLTALLATDNTVRPYRRYKAAFHRFDTDRDGVITSRELGKILRYIGQNPTEAEVQEMMDSADKANQA